MNLNKKERQVFNKLFYWSLFFIIIGCLLFLWLNVSVFIGLGFGFMFGIGIYQQLLKENKILLKGND